MIISRHAHNYMTCSQQVVAILADFWSRGVVIIGGAIVAAS
jgi:hypothetical protein